MTSRPIPELATAASAVLSALDDAGVRACVIGALAVHRWGQPRATSDADFSALASYGDERPVIDALLARFEARRPDAVAFALTIRVLLAHKLVAARTHDLGDMESIVRRQVGRLDLECIRRWGQEFAELKEDPDLLRPFEEALRHLRGGR